MLSSVWAQIEMPQPSPAASVMQTVGLTQVTIEYSSPAAKGREVWGKLVPYGKAWRAGANAPTKITFSRNVVVEGNEIPAGSYNLFISPFENDAWKVHFNKAGKSVFAYEDQAALEKDDLCAIKVKPEEAPKRERLLYFITANDEKTGTITLHWDNMSISFDFKTDTDTHALESIKNGMAQYGSLWYTFSNTANYYIENGQSVDQAMTWVDQALAMRADHFYPHWIKAKVLAAKGDYPAAIETATAAQKVGEKSGGNFYKSLSEQMATSLADWTKKKKK
ncbi:MAG: DUF2911 domain-containing protein [Bernardetiaceae bacterium]